MRVWITAVLVGVISLTACDKSPSAESDSPEKETAQDEKPATKEAEKPAKGGKKSPNENAKEKNVKFRATLGVPGYERMWSSQMMRSKLGKLKIRMPVHLKKDGGGEDDGGLVTVTVDNKGDEAKPHFFALGISATKMGCNAQPGQKEHPFEMTIESVEPLKGSVSGKMSCKAKGETEAKWYAVEGEFDEDGL